MFILTIILVSTIGIIHPVALRGNPGQPYATLQDCQQAATDTINWLTQDHIEVKATCEEVK